MDKCKCAICGKILKTRRFFSKHRNAKDKYTFPCYHLDSDGRVCHGFFVETTLIKE
jgi:hypothetical protein